MADGQARTDHLLIRTIMQVRTSRFRVHCFKQGYNESVQNGQSDYVVTTIEEAACRECNCVIKTTRTYIFVRRGN